MKYEYFLLTWGGFYNKEYKDLHNEKPGYHYFDNKEDRDNYISKLRGIEKELSASYLMLVEREGYHVRSEVTINRVSKFEGKEIHTERKMGPGFEYSSAIYHLENKWYPGFNDYPFGEDFDYDTEGFEVIQEWVTGAFAQETD
jgi:hypothetical protein